MSPSLYLLISFGSLTLLVLGLIAGYFLGKSIGAADASGQFKEAVSLWRNAVDKIDESTRRSVVQLGSVRQRLTDLNQSMKDPRLTAPIDELTDQLCALEKVIQNLKASSEALPPDAATQKVSNSLEVDSSNNRQRPETQLPISPAYSFDDFVSVVKKKVEAGSPLKAVLDFVYQELPTFIPCQRMGYAEIDYDADRVTAEWYRSERPGQLTGGYSAPLSTSSLRFLTEKGRPRVLNNLPEYLRKHPDSASTRLIVREGYRSSLTLPIVADESVVAFLFISNVDVNSFEEESVKLARKVVKQIGYSKYLPKKRSLSKPALT